MESGVALLDQGHAEKHRADREGTARKTDTRESENRDSKERNCAAIGDEEDVFPGTRGMCFWGQAGYVVSEIPLWSCCIPAELSFLDLESV